MVLFSQIMKTRLPRGSINWGERPQEASRKISSRGYKKEQTVQILSIAGKKNNNLKSSLKTEKGQKCWEQIYLGICLQDIRSITEGQRSKESLNTEASAIDNHYGDQRRMNREIFHTGK